MNKSKKALNIKAEKKKKEKEKEDKGNKKGRRVKRKQNEKKNKKPVLAVDLGEKKAGLAFSPAGSLIFPAGLVEFKNEKEIPGKISKKAEEKGARILVIGLPLDKKGKMNEQSRWVKKMAGKIAEKINLPIFFVDEHLTSREAVRKRAQKEKKNKIKQEEKSKRENWVDEEAAGIILKDFFKSKDKEEGEECRQ